jgi:Uma2 family endonuclease
MNDLLDPGLAVGSVPDHTQLPDKDGVPMKNFQEAPQSRLLTDTLEPVLHLHHPDGRYAIGRDCGIYYHLTDPPLRGCTAPDWFYMGGVPAMLGGQYRRSYVLWQEVVAPLLVIEYVPGDGSEERDRTPGQGKFWVYEQGIRVPFYAIFEPLRERVEVHHLVDGYYQLLPANERGHFPIAPLGVELGIWHGQFETATTSWLRWWDARGNLLPTSAERAEQERQAREQARQAEDQERQAKDQALSRAERLAARLRELGVDPDSV